MVMVWNSSLALPGVTEEQQLGRETPQKVGVSHLNLKHLHLSKQALHKLLIRKTISTSSI